MDWLAPWWSPWRAVGRRVAARVLQGARVCDALNDEQRDRGAPLSGAPPTYTPSFSQGLEVRPATRWATHSGTPWPIQFVPQSALREGVAYETFIFESGQVPSRENLHDFFNGLAWLVFPHTKRRLNTLQYGALASGGVQATRGALRDALTLFDENAAIWPCASGAARYPTMETASQLIEALRAKQWHRACIELRAHWQGNVPVLFGHALLEKLVSPYKSITSHVYIAHTATENVADCDLDSVVAAQLSPAELEPKPFIPLPVLGVPLWWAANADPAFYDDAQVFRAPRDIVLKTSASTPKP